MKRIIYKLDNALERLTEQVTSVLLLIIVLVVLYSVLMRYVFNHPPFWSDRISIFANIGMILFGLSLTVRSGELISMQALYEKISPAFALYLDATWNGIILIFSMVYAWYGLDAAVNMPGQYWDFQEFCIDLGIAQNGPENFLLTFFKSLENIVGYAVRPFCVDGAIPQKYLAMLMPISGILLVIASIGVIIRDAKEIIAMRQ
ncbi:MAG: TRAP transporter small permease subunit [Rhodospirillales bacterium]|nr:TRAP transporter small permease subunit [Rhodospirillales bacterium]